MTRALTHKQFLRRLRDECRPTQIAFARAHGISPTQLSETLRDRRPPSPQILKAMGVERHLRVTYIPTEDAA